MAQIIEQSDRFGKIGKAFGEGLGDAIPKEVERYRLSEGLKKFEQESGNLTPIQQLTRLSSIPGATPQMIQSFGDLARQQAKSSAFVNKANSTEDNPYKRKPLGETSNSNVPSTTTAEPVDATLNPYIPKTLEQIQQRTGELIEQNPGLYASDPQKAFQDATIEDQQLLAKSNALQAQRHSQQDVQNKIQKDLETQKSKLGADVPGDVYSSIEDKAINAVKPTSKGGEGLTEQQAIKTYGKELQDVSKDYQAIKSIGKWSLFSRSPQGNKDALRSLQKKFKEREDLENFASSLIAENNLSPSKAHYLAYPISDSKELNNKISKLPDVPKNVVYNGGQPQIGNSKTDELTYKVVPEIAEILKNDKNASVLAIAEELKSRGYNPTIWMDYVDKNRKEMKLSESQARELSYPRDFKDSIDDMWLFYFSGLDKLVEQK